MSKRYDETLDYLRWERDVLNQTITNLEMLNGDRAMGPVTPSAGAQYVAVTVEAPSTRKALPPARAVATPAAVDGRRTAEARNLDTQALAALRSGDMAPDAFRKKLGIDRKTGKALLYRLRADRRMVVIGTGRGTRYALPKEAP